jgi:hypothetical protein
MGSRSLRWIVFVIVGVKVAVAWDVAVGEGRLDVAEGNGEALADGNGRAVVDVQADRKISAASSQL